MVYNIDMNDIGFTIRPCSAEDTDRWVAFLDEAFGYQHPHTYAVDFAPSFQPHNLKNGRLLFVGDELASTGISCLKTAVTPTGSLKIAVIGAIATAPAWRKKGYSKRILEWLIGEAEASGADGCLLWSDNPEFYARFGFKPVGKQLLYPLKNLDVPVPAEDLKLEPVWTSEEVLPLYEQHRSRVMREHQDWKDLERITSCLHFQARDREGTVQAYAGVGRGKDMVNVIHEWGGTAQGLFLVLQRFLEAERGLFWLSHPILEDPVRSLLDSQGIKPETGPMGLFYTCEAGKKRAELPKILDQLWFWGLDSL
jgi:predicted N-acetyltransferase YhbS